MLCLFLGRYLYSWNLHNRLPSSHFIVGFEISYSRIVYAWSLYISVKRAEGKKVKVGLPAADSKCWMRKVERKKIDILEFSAGNQNILYKLRPLNGNWQRTEVMIIVEQNVLHIFAMPFSSINYCFYKCICHKTCYFIYKNAYHN